MSSALPAPPAHLREGKRQIVSLHIPGDIPDLHGLRIEVMDHALAALTGSEAALIPPAALQELCAKFPAVAGALWRESLADAAVLREWVVSLGRRGSRARIAHFLCELVARFQAAGLSDGQTCPMPLSQTDIGDATGLTNVHVNRIVRDLREARLIALSTSVLQVLDWPGLAAAGEFDPIYLHLRPSNEQPGAVHGTANRDPRAS
jgi:CRP-like cAMP-binding protein